MKWLERPAGWIDRVLRPRLTWFPARPACAWWRCSASFSAPPFRHWSFFPSPPQSHGAIALMGLGLMVRDGLVILLAALGAIFGLGVMLIMTTMGGG